MHSYKDNVTQFCGESDTGSCTQIEQENSLEALFKKAFSDLPVSMPRHLQSGIEAKFGCFSNRARALDQVSLREKENNSQAIVLQQKHAVTHLALCTDECQGYVDGLSDQPWNRGTSEAVDAWLRTGEATFEQLTWTVLRGGVV